MDYLNEIFDSYQYNKSININFFKYINLYNIIVEEINIINIINLNNKDIQTIKIITSILK